MHGIWYSANVRKAPILTKGKEPIPKDSRFAIDVIGVEERVALEYVINAITAIRVHILAPPGQQDFTVPPPPLWQAMKQKQTYGDTGPDLQEKDIVFVDKHFNTFKEYLLPETFTRVGNALRLYESSLLAENPDLALLGFIGAIESLFSIAPQELSFRLSFLIAKVLGDNQAEQRKLYDRARKIYTVRSKIAHGDKLYSNEEASAIQLVDYYLS